MQINQVMTPRCRTCNPSDSLRQAAQYMAQDDIGVLPIAKDDYLVGMLTDRDIVTRGLASPRDINEFKTGDLMSDQVLYCYDDQKTDEVARNMGELQIRRMPVVNREKQLVGMVSLGDLASRGADDAAGEALTDISEPG